MPTIECTLHGSLEDSLPAGGHCNQTQLAFEFQPSVDEILSTLGINREQLQFVLADGHYVEIEDWGKSVNARAVQLWPRMSGG